MDVVVVEIREPGREARRVMVTGSADIGRECNGFVVIDESVSRRHVAVTPHAEGIALTDLGSRNGTLLNGTRVDGTAVVRPGDVVRLGQTELEVIGTAAPPPALSETYHAQVLEPPGAGESDSPSREPDLAPSRAAPGKDRRVTLDPLLGDQLDATRRALDHELGGVAENDLIEALIAVGLDRLDAVRSRLARRRDTR